MLIPGVPVLLLCGWAVVGVCAIQALIAVLRAFVPGVPAGVVKPVAGALADALRDGGDPAAAIAAVAPRLRWPYSWRATAAARDLTADPAAGIVATLGRHRLVPASLVAGGSAAERLGGHALAQWTGSLAARPGWAETLLRPLFLYGGLAVLLVALFTFFRIFISPKFAQIARDLGMVLDDRLRLVAALPDSRTVIIAMVLAATTLAAALGAWHWRRLRRMLAAEVVLAGTASGASEGEIAAAFAGAVAQRAGTNGDFPALAAAIGWPGVADPTALAGRLTEAEERARRRRTGLRLALQIVTPVILAIPVWLIASGMFATLISLLNAVGDGGLS